MSETNESIREAVLSDTPRGRLARLVALGLDHTRDISSWSVDYQLEMLQCADAIISQGWIEKED